MLRLAASYSGLRYIVGITLFLGINVLTGCFPPRPTEVCRKFYDLSPGEREVKIRSSGINDQIDLYFCGMYQEPPTDFANIVADRGAAAMPALLERLRTEESDTRQDFILHIFEKMAERGYLRGRRDVVEQLHEVVRAMKNEQIKQSSQQRLRAIEGNV